MRLKTEQATLALTHVTLLNTTNGVLITRTEYIHTYFRVTYVAVVGSGVLQLAARIQ